MRPQTSPKVPLPGTGWPAQSLVPMQEIRPRKRIPFFSTTPIIRVAICAAFGFFGAFAEVNAQPVKGGIFGRYLTALINDTTDISRPQILAYPALSYSPETSWEFGVSGLYVYYANRDTANRLSEIKAYAFYTLESQYGVLARNALYTHNNNWSVLGQVRFQKFPLLYFGIGPDTESEYLALVDATQLQVKERVLRRIGKSFFAGIGLDLQQLHDVNFRTDGREALTQLPPGAEGVTTLGFGPTIILDNRKNVLNVRRGVYSEWSVLHYRGLGSSSYKFTNLLADQRLFVPLNRRDVLATQLLGNFNFGQAPFNQLALMGGESMMRGYYLGRYRDNNLLAAQAEYRFLPMPFGFSNRWGAAVFDGYGAVTDELKNLKGSNFVWSAGGGLRFLVFPKKDIFTRLDVGFTEEGSGFYIFIGEAF